MEMMGTAVTDPAFFRDLAGRLGSADPLEVPYFEVLMEVMEMADAPVQTRIVAIRRVP